MTRQAGEKRFLLLDALRGVGALIVMLYHFTEFVGISLVPLGFAFVDFFFVLSGFVIAHAYRQRIAEGLTVGVFMGQRLARLYPLFLLGLVLGAVVLLFRSLAGMTQLGLAGAIGSVIANLFYLPFFNAAVNTVFGMEYKGELYPANGPAWSLFFELVINLVFFYMVRIRAMLLVASVIAAYFILVFRVHAGFGVGGWGTENFFSGFPRVYYGFFAGTLLYMLFSSAKLVGVRRGLAAWSLPVMSIILAGCLVIAALQLADLRISFVIAISVFPLLVLAGAMVEVPRRLIVLCSWAGALSYPVYCLHYPIGLGFELMIGQGLLRPPVAILLAMEIGLTLLAAWLAIRLYERPARLRIAALLAGSTRLLRGR